MTLSFGFRIEGEEKVDAAVRRLTPAALKAIREKAAKRANQTVAKFQQEMAQEYTSQWATGLLARGITHKTIISGDGVDVQFFIKDRKELRYVTAALGGYFQQFPVGPFVIKPTSGKALSIPLPAGGRAFTRGAGGRFTGSRAFNEEFGGRIAVKQVLWGRKTGGFSRDVISEVMQEESVLFVQDMQEAVQGAIVQVTS
jgi:hypothetical protein